MVTAIDKNTALVVIDMQKGIVKFPVVHPIEGVIDNVVKLVAAFRKEGLPIVIVNVDPAGNIAAKARTDASRGAAPMQFPPEFLEIIPEIPVHKEDIRVTKHSWSAFPTTAIDEELKKRNVTGIVLAGVSTSIGVEGTARSANEKGYNITFAKDAMTDMKLSAHENSVDTIFPRMGEVDVTAAIIAKLSDRT
ncbi:MAG TPA: isochorismatase family protein [Ferruginibacter sp.]|jgi:nicotinamidase-related amidase|nr:isochorismatase family protein [Ferruginibacter sp.]